MMELVQTVALVYLMLLCTVIFFEIYDHNHPGEE